MRNYDPKKIERKWQRKWEETGIYCVGEKSSKPKWYSLIEFPYPSGEGLHVGHIRSNTAMDIISRKRRMEGFNVLYPIGWDAFGLPTENYAIKTGIHPAKVTKKNTGIFRKQLKSIGFSFDWNREINTSNPNYYKWTQWIFLQLFKEGLAYKQKSFINWCLDCKTGLANEEVVAGNCERCGAPIVKREKDQWMLAITKYADRLDKDLDKVDYLPEIKLQQRNWIGRSEGSELKFKLVIKSDTESKKNKAEKNKIVDSVSVFTTRADTLFGVTYIVLAPEHYLVTELISQIENKKEVEDYIKKTLNKTDTDRQADGKEKTGVELKGVRAINPANNEEIPMFIADYVLVSYGTGAVMAVPAHDERDWAFAIKYGLPIKNVIAPFYEDKIKLNKSTDPTIHRSFVHCILRDPKTGEIACLKWDKKDEQVTFIDSEIIKQEDVILTGKKELTKKSGYTGIKFIKEIGSYFNGSKKEAGFSTNRVLLFELTDYSQIKVVSGEKEKYEMVWLSPEKITEILKNGMSKLVWGLFQEEHQVYVDYGVLVNSGKFDGLTSELAKNKITKFVAGEIVTKYKLRDWVFSRQHYWGEPIPLVFCPTCAKAMAGKENAGWIPVLEKDLPVKLPNIKNYKPANNGESPLASELDWVNTKCPICKGPAKRETDTMPNWAGSSWYFLRYTDPANMKSLADFKKLTYWQPVDWYNGGAEHITLHLLYSRFWNKFLYDIGVVPVDEPYRKRTTHGMILGEGGIKMSKSKGNVVNPDEVVKTYGADTLRVYEMFMGPFDQSIIWSIENIIGSRRFLEKIWQISKKVGKLKPIESFDSLTQKMIKKVGEDIEQMSFNTAISSMMVWVNEADKQKEISVKLMSDFLKILAPFAPHITEELWSELGHKKSIHLESWPTYDEAKLLDKWVKIVVQINGKIRDLFEIETGTKQSEVEDLALNREIIKRWLSGQRIKKCIYIQDKLLNIVV